VKKHSVPIKYYLPKEKKVDNNNNIFKQAKLIKTFYALGGFLEKKTGSLSFAPEH
jgi:hypothetical protein